MDEDTASREKGRRINNRRPVWFHDAGLRLRIIASGSLLGDCRLGIGAWGSPPGDRRWARPAASHPRTVGSESSEQCGCDPVSHIGILTATSPATSSVRLSFRQSRPDLTPAGRLTARRGSFFARRPIDKTPRLPMFAGRRLYSSSSPSRSALCAGPVNRLPTGERAPVRAARRGRNLGGSVWIASGPRLDRAR